MLKEQVGSIYGQPHYIWLSLHLPFEISMDSDSMATGQGQEASAELQGEPAGIGNGGLNFRDVAMRQHPGV